MVSDIIVGKRYVHRTKGSFTTFNAVNITRDVHIQTNVKRIHKSSICLFSFYLKLIKPFLICLKFPFTHDNLSIIKVLIHNYRPDFLDLFNNRSYHTFLIRVKNSHWDNINTCNSYHPFQFLYGVLHLHHIYRLQWVLFHLDF